MSSVCVCMFYAWLWSLYLKYVFCLQRTSYLWLKWVLLLNDNTHLYVSTFPYFSICLCIFFDGEVATLEVFKSASWTVIVHIQSMNPSSFMWAPHEAGLEAHLSLLLAPSKTRRPHLYAGLTHSNGSLRRQTLTDELVSQVLDKVDSGSEETVWPWSLTCMSPCWPWTGCCEDLAQRASACFPCKSRHSALDAAQIQHFCTPCN